MWRILAYLIVAGSAAACSSTPPLPQGSSTRVTTTHESASLAGRVIEHALAMLGVPYRFGGNRPETGFDCSGLVHYAYSMSGVAVPRTSQAQFRAARKVALTEVRPGDLLFFQDQEKLSHVGLYIGERMFAHAPSSGSSVSLASIDSAYYQRNLVAVGRLLAN